MNTFLDLLFDGSERRAVPRPQKVLVMSANSGDEPRQHYGAALFKASICHLGLVRGNFTCHSGTSRPGLLPRLPCWRPWLLCWTPAAWLASRDNKSFRNRNVNIATVPDQRYSESTSQIRQLGDASRRGMRSGSHRRGLSPR